MWNDPAWTLSIHSDSSQWHSTHVHHVCNCWHNPRPAPRLSLHTIVHSSPGQEQNVGGTTPRWHAKLFVSYSCCLRGTEHDTGAQGPLLFDVSFQILSSTTSVRWSTYRERGVWSLGMSIQHGSNILMGPNCYGIQVTSPPPWHKTHNGGACVATEWKTQSQCTPRSRSFVRHSAWRSASRSSIWRRSSPLLPQRARTWLAPTVRKMHSLNSNFLLITKVI